MHYNYLTEKDVKRIVKEQIYKDKFRSHILNLMTRPSETISRQSINDIIDHRLSKHEKMVEAVAKSMILESLKTESGIKSTLDQLNENFKQSSRNLSDSFDKKLNENIEEIKITHNKFLEKSEKRIEQSTLTAVKNIERLDEHNLVIRRIQDNVKYSYYTTSFFTIALSVVGGIAGGYFGISLFNGNNKK